MLCGRRLLSPELLHPISLSLFYPFWEVRSDEKKVYVDLDNRHFLQAGYKRGEMAKGFLYLASDDCSYMTGGDPLPDGAFRNL